MRVRKAVTACIIAFAVFSSGCIQGDGEGSSDGHDADNPETAREGTMGDHQGEDREEGGDPSVNPSSSRKGEDGSGLTTRERDPCTAEDPLVPADPEDQQVGSTDQLTCPGQFVVLSEGSGEAWDVPERREGQNWRYRVESPLPEAGCWMEYEDRVVDSGTVAGVGALFVETTDYDCEGEEIGTSNHSVTVSSLAPVREDGYVAHDQVFPLREGKQWLWVEQINETDLRQVRVESTLDPQFEFQGESLSAWSVQSETSEGSRHQWWGVESGVLLREDLRNQDGVTVVSTRWVESG